MAPSDEQASFVTQPSKTVSLYEKSPSTPRSCGRKRIVACAVNYEPAMVDCFSTGGVEFPTSGTCTPEMRTTHHERSPSCEENLADIHNATNMRRVSKRETKQRSVSMTPKSVRYDMELVPRVQKNANFYTSLSSEREEAPFFTSVIWRPVKRKEWEDCLSELVAVCTSAGLRKYSSQKGRKKTAFVPPLSREYIRDRIDIDDPLRGVQVRHATQGWLQGFLLWTNFTTWTHYFTWDSTHSLSGLDKCTFAKDASGDLGRELQALPRTGNPQDSGVIFENVAEIALLGGLGCGELLFKMALQEIILQSQYKYVVLQATLGSRSFYERFGFVRVGAVCRYGDSQSHLPSIDTPIQGYRHWTHANECQKSLDMHGGPSYMMCLKLPETSPSESNRLLHVLQKYTVQDKPKIEATPMTPTPKSGRKLKRTSSLNSATSPELPNLTPTGKRVYADMAALKAAPLKPPPPSSTALATSTKASSNKRPRRSSSNVALSHQITPPALPPNTSAAAQYQQAPWMTVPSTSTTTTTTATNTKNTKNTSTSTPTSTNTTKSSLKRKPPRSRSSASSNSNKNTTKKPVSPRSLGSTPLQKQVVPSDKIQKVDKAVLCKQKVKSYPRDRLHFYNKVVTPKACPQKKYYFVLHYSEPKAQVTLVPMAVKGILSGRRQGRPRFQCLLEKTSTNWITVPSKLYTPVEAFMVMKTPIVAQEAWDILGA